MQTEGKQEEKKGRATKKIFLPHEASHICPFCTREGKVSIFFLVTYLWGYFSFGYEYQNINFIILDQVQQHLIMKWVDCEQKQAYCAFVCVCAYFQ